MVKVTPQLIIGASLASAATAGLAYAIYFDYKRRNDPEFRRALREFCRIIDEWHRRLQSSYLLSYTMLT